MVQADWGPVHHRGRLGDPFPEDDVCSGRGRQAGESEERLFWAPGNPVGRRPGRGAKNKGARGEGRIELDRWRETGGVRRSPGPAPRPSAALARDPPLILWSPACAEPATRLPASSSLPRGGGGASGSRFSRRRSLFLDTRVSCPWCAPRLPASGAIFSLPPGRWGLRAPLSRSLVSRAAGSKTAQPPGALFTGCPGAPRCSSRPVQAVHPSGVSRSRNPVLPPAAPRSHLRRPEDGQSYCR